MNKFNKYIVALSATIAVGASMTSCKNEEDDIFSSSAAERLEATKSENFDLLCSAPAGWAMQYFADNTNEGGYTYLFKFNKNSSVKIAGNNALIGNKYKEETSMFEIITDDGPVLTFNTYNSIFHVLADPYDVPSTPDDESGYGHRGDYEFVIMEASKDGYRLQGKKHGMTIMMTPLPEGTDWETYLNDLKEFGNSLFDSRLYPLMLDVDGNRFTLNQSTAGVFDVVPDGGDAISETSRVPYIVNDNGIRFQKPFTGKDDVFSVQSFKLEEGRLVSEAGQDAAAITAYGTPANTFMLEKCVWSLDPESLGGDFVEPYQRIAAETEAELKRNFLGFNFLYDKKEKSGEQCYMLSFLNSKSSAKTYVYSDFQITESGNFRFNVSTTDGNLNGKNRLQRIPALTDFINVLNSSEYTVSCDAPIIRTNLEFVSVTKPENKFSVSLK